MLRGAAAAAADAPAGATAAATAIVDALFSEVTDTSAGCVLRLAAPPSGLTANTCVVPRAVVTPQKESQGLKLSSLTLDGV
jgi:hypothetical protein